HPTTKVFPRVADLCLHMVNPISSSQVSQANKATKPAAPKPQQTQPKSSPLPSDTVTLKSTAGVDHDGDSH
ncbi:MAG: hypothetical protein WBW98_11765, partial [Candidatus Sulfotelmatobacter sp.]